MPVDRKLASDPISEDRTPPWCCPTCAVGHFRLMKETLHCALHGPHEMAFHADWFDAEQAEYRFVALLRCSNDSCKEVAAVAGRGITYSLDDYERNLQTYGTLFYPTYFNPSPPLIEIPPRCPENVAEQLRRAFVASWDQPGAATGRVRIAIELLLTHLKVPKTKTRRDGRRARLNLHDRITALPTQHTNIKTALLAIKWLGNAGAHEAEMSRTVIYDALDILEVVLRTLYDDQDKHIARLVKAVNKRQGPT